MKVVLWLLMTLFFLRCYASQPFIPPSYRDTLTLSKDVIFPTDTFQVCYSIKKIYGQAHVYVRLMERNFCVIGSNLWDGDVSDKETTTITFTVIIKDDILKNLNGDRLAVEIGFQQRSFIDGHNTTRSKRCWVKIDKTSFMMPIIKKFNDGEEEPVEEDAPENSPYEIDSLVVPRRY